MSSMITSLGPGESILTEQGPVAVVAVQRHGLLVESAAGSQLLLPHAQVVARRFDGEHVGAVHASLHPWWNQLPEPVQQEALFKLECVLEILTGYRHGVASLALPGEPYYPFGDGWGESLRQRQLAMSRAVSLEKHADRAVMRRIHDGQLQTADVGLRTIQVWCETYDAEGLRGLVDGRSLRKIRDFSKLEAPYRQAADEVFSQFDGTPSAVNLQEIQRRIHQKLRRHGHGDLVIPERLEAEYLRFHYQRLGKKTRAHRSRSLREVSTTASAALHHPGHCASDVTRADNLIIDPYTGKALSVEIGSIMSVPTRVILALRVFPKSVTAFEISLLLYDAMRPFSMAVDSEVIDDWRWCGVPTSLEVDEAPLPATVKPGEGVQGLHHIPGLVPTTLRTDHGSIYVSASLRNLLNQFGITLTLSRGKMPTDNPHMERFHETLQRAYQQLPGYKGRNVSERGTTAGVTGTEPLLTASQLETHLRAFVALDYHRRPHAGLVIPGAEEQPLTPLEMFDALLSTTGRLHYPQHPDLLYQFLPIRWLTIRHAGVEYKNMGYDADVLDEFRDCRPGFFREKDAAAPFLYDPRDTTRLWFRHPETDRVHEIPWRGRHLLTAPLVDVVRDQALARIRQRAGTPRTPKAMMHELIDEIGHLTLAPHDEAEATKLAAARLRWAQGQKDHNEAHQAELHRLPPASIKPTTDRPTLHLVPGLDPTQAGHEATEGLASLFEPWPDYTEGA